MNIVTVDLSDFGFRELKAAARLLTLLAEDGLPSNMTSTGLALNFNMNSGYVFLMNSEYEVAIEVDGKLVEYLTCGNCGEEGTANDLDFDYNYYLCGDCTKQVKAEEEEDGDGDGDEAW